MSGGALDAKARKIAFDKLAIYGKPITFIRKAQATTNAETGVRTAAADVTITGIFGFAQTYSQKEVGGGNGSILASDKHVIISALSLVVGDDEYEPQKGDQIVMNGVTWSVEGNKPVEGAINIMHDVQVRK